MDKSPGGETAEQRQAQGDPEGRGAFWLWAGAKGAGGRHAKAQEQGPGKYMALRTNGAGPPSYLTQRQDVSPG